MIVNDKYYQFFETEFAKNCKFHWDFISRNKELDKWFYLAKQYEKNKNIKPNKNINKIPKIIHQIWIGPKKLPQKYIRWMNSWKLLNPDWDYIFWDNNRIKDLEITDLKVYKDSNNYGFKSDLLRYEILRKYGGLYADTDFECLQKLPKYLLNYNFVSSVVFSWEPTLNNAIILAQPGSKLLEDLLNNIKSNKRINKMSVFDSSGPFLLTKLYFNLGNNEKNKILILPSNLFYPFPSFLLETKIQIKNLITKESIGIHHWERSWFMKPLFIRILIEILSKIKVVIKKVYYKIFELNKCLQK